MHADVKSKLLNNPYFQHISVCNRNRRHPYTHLNSKIYNILKAIQTSMMFDGLSFQRAGAFFSLKLVHERERKGINHILCILVHI